MQVPDLSTACTAALTRLYKRRTMRVNQFIPGVAARLVKLGYATRSEPLPTYPPCLTITPLGMARFLGKPDAKYIVFRADSGILFADTLAEALRCVDVYVTQDKAEAMERGDEKVDIVYGSAHAVVYQTQKGGE